MLKWIGAAIILSAGTAYGFAKAARYAKRPQQLRQLGGALTMLESEIVYGVRPLPSALQRVATATPKPVSQLFAEASQRLSGSDGLTAERGWTEAVNAVWPSLSLMDTEREALLALAPLLGLTDRDDQAKHLKLAAARLAFEEEAAREEYVKFGKMWRNLGALTAALIVILMY